MKTLPPMSPVPPERVRYRESVDWKYDLTDPSGDMVSHHVYGEHWSFRLSGLPRGDEGKALISKWFQDQRAEILSEQSHRMVAHLPRRPDGSRLWFFLVPSASPPHGDVVRERLLRPGEPLEIPLGPEGFRTCDVTLVHDGRSFHNLLVDIEAERVSIRGELKQLHGDFRRHLSHRRDCDPKRSRHHVVSDLPQLAGRYRYRVSSGGKTQQTVRLVLELGPDLDVPEISENIGGLRVRNVSYGKVRLRPEFDDALTHPGFSPESLNGDRMPNGDAVFWVPSGYWTLSSIPREGSGVRVAESHMVPVHAGRMTLVDWPWSLNRAFSPAGSGRLEILDAAPSGQVDISLLELEDTEIVPTPKNTTVFEGGLPGEVLSVEPLTTPLEVVLLLDSSGSMKGAMKQALDATRRFLERLPEDARITVVDFDTAPRVLPGETRQELSKALETVRARGATALYDSILLGLGRIEKSNRPALVVFTDGVDANWNDTKPGSKATKPEVMVAVEQSRVPVFTIGFGKQPDVDTLQRVASLSGGSYYQALDEAGLDRVFASITANLGHQYRVRYARPTRQAASDVPVLALVVDNSGSMDMDPRNKGCRNKGCDFRIEKVRQILHHFVGSLPEEFLVQLLTFSDRTSLNQVVTASRSLLQRALSLMKGEGGTDILGSTQAALETLRAIPSTRRYLVYLADAAMKVKAKEQQELDTILGKLADSGIRSLFLGIVEKDEGGAFAHAAELAKGRAVVSKDLAGIEKAFSDLAAEVTRDSSDAEGMSLRVNLRHRRVSGKNEFFSATRFIEFPALEAQGEPLVPEQVSWKKGGRLAVYDGELGRLVSGDNLLIRDVRVTKRIPLDIEARSDALSLRLHEAVFLSRLQGLNAPSGYRFLVLPLTLDNRLEPQDVAVYADGSLHPAAWVGGSAKPERIERRTPPCLIPDFRRHLFLRWNNERTLPVSEVTWLAEEPLVLPGERALLVPPAGSVTGALVYLVPETEMEQSSLHFYDTEYGHIDVPITGVMEGTREAIETLPEGAPTRLSDAFQLTLRGFEDREKLADLPAGEGFVFRVLTATLTSRVQALLDVAPAERFTLRLPSHRGDLVFPLHPITDVAPLGFYRSTMLAPGSRNPVRLVFRIPAVLAKATHKGTLAVDLHGGGVTIPLAGVDTPAPAELGPAHATGQGISVWIHAAGPVKPKLAGVRGKPIAVEVTFQDEKDGSHTRLGSLLVLRKKTSEIRDREQYAAALDKARMQAAVKTRGLGDFAKTGVAGPEVGLATPRALSHRLCFALDETSVVADGMARRGLVLFELPEGEKLSDWEVGSLVLADLAHPVTEVPYTDEILLAARQELEDAGDARFWDRFRETVSRLARRRAAAGYTRPGHVEAPRAAFEAGALGKRHVPVPAITATAAGELAGIDTEAELLDLLKGLRWVPGQAPAWAYRHCPEAVLTQRWGTSSDLARVAEVVLNRLGIPTSRRSLKLTKEGRLALSERIGVKDFEEWEVPGLFYEDATEKERLLVLPFLEDVSELTTFVDWDRHGRETSERRARAGLSIKVLVEPVSGSRQQSIRHAANVLAGAGGGGPRTIELLSHHIHQDELSEGAVDIGYTEVTNGGRKELRCVFDGPGGRRVGKKGVPTGDFVVREEILEVKSDQVTHVVRRPLIEGRSLTGRFHTLGLNLPDLPRDRATKLGQLRSEAHAGASAPDDLSALRWYSRTVLTRFIAAQTRFEQELAEDLSLVTGRSIQGRCLLVTLERERPEDAPEARVDLLQVQNDVFPGQGSEAEKATRAFRILSGLAAARFEASAIPGGKGVGVFELWERSPDGTELVGISRRDKKAFLQELEERGYPEHLRRRIKESKGHLLFPTRPVILSGQPRWGWLELDPRTLAVISRLDSGEAGAMVESIIGNLYEQATNYLLGALVGVSSSLWAVSAFSLELEDFDEILEKAQEFAMALSKRLDPKEGRLGWNIGGKPSIEGVKLGRFVKFELTLQGIKGSNDLLGFSNGYKDSVAYYFQRARSSP